MLETLAQGFRLARARLKGFREITESNIEDAIESVRLSLLEADVEYHVAKAFLERVKQKAVGELVRTKVEYKGKELRVTPADHFIKICYDELVALMGPADPSLKENKERGFSTIMMVGLQGSGKTTTAAKLANYLQRRGEKALLVAADVYRPAAVEQLAILAERVNAEFFFKEGLMPPQLCKEALQYAKEKGVKWVIYDTAGRLAIDEELMLELEQIDREVRTDNILLVVDAMIGQDAVNQAREFNRRLDIDGVILTKLDGDARGGAALSVKAVTGKPIKFIGVGEGLDRLEEFRPDGLASRILGFGDIVGLVKDFERVVDEAEAEARAEKMLKGEINFVTFLEQIKMLKKLGPLQDVVEKLPFFADTLPGQFQVDEKALVKIESMIQSMTKEERLHPEILNESRIRRIAKGSGRTVEDVKNLIAQLNMMRQLMRQIGKKPKLLSRIPGIGQLLQAKELEKVDITDMLPSAAPVEKIKKRQRGLSAEEIAKRRKKEKLARQQRKLQRQRQKKKKKKKKKKK